MERRDSEPEAEGHRLGDRSQTQSGGEAERRGSREEGERAAVGDPGEEQLLRLDYYGLHVDIEKQGPCRASEVTSSEGNSIGGTKMLSWILFQSFFAIKSLKQYILERQSIQLN